MYKQIKFMLNGLLSVAMLAATHGANAQISNDTIKIGFITDMSGVYADVDGPAGAEAIKMAIAEFGGMLNGKKKLTSLLAKRANGLINRALICLSVVRIQRQRWPWLK